MENFQSQYFEKHIAFPAVILYPYDKNIRVCPLAPGKSKPWAYSDTQLFVMIDGIEAAGRKSTGTS